MNIQKGTKITKTLGRMYLSLLFLKKTFKEVQALEEQWRMYILCVKIMYWQISWVMQRWVVCLFTVVWFIHILHCSHIYSSGKESEITGNPVVCIHSTIYSPTKCQKDYFWHISGLIIHHITENEKNIHIYVLDYTDI